MSSGAVEHPVTTRRLDLDWIRIGVFGLLILYHVGMFYVTWDWHVKSPRTSQALELLMLQTAPWRLTLLFLVSGCATAFILSRSGARVARERSSRLLIPLLFGMLVVVTPQAYLEVVQKSGYTGSYREFWGRYLRADDSFCNKDGCLELPTWNHLWFVAYLWVYTMVLLAIRRFAPGVLDAAERGVATLRGWRLLLGPWLFFALIRISLLSAFPSTHALVDDVYNHAQYLPAFFFGYLLIRQSPTAGVWEELTRLRWPAALLAVAAGIFVAVYFAWFRDTEPPDALRLAQRAVWALCQWCAIVAVLGFVRRMPLTDGPWRRYLTEAVFPFYIVHQTAIVVVGYHLAPLALPIGVEVALLIGATALACVVAYEVARRSGWLRPLFGLKATDRRAVDAT